MKQLTKSKILPVILIIVIIVIAKHIYVSRNYMCLCLITVAILRYCNHILFVSPPHNLKNYIYISDQGYIFAQGAVYLILVPPKMNPEPEIPNFVSSIQFLQFLLLLSLFCSVIKYGTILGGTFAGKIRTNNRIDLLECVIPSSRYDRYKYI